MYWDYRGKSSSSMRVSQPRHFGCCPTRFQGRPITVVLQATTQLRVGCYRTFALQIHDTGARSLSRSGDRPLCLFRIARGGSVHGLDLPEAESESCLVREHNILLLSLIPNINLGLQLMLIVNSQINLVLGIICISLLCQMYYYQFYRPMPSWKRFGNRVTKFCKPFDGFGFDTWSVKFGSTCWVCWVNKMLKFTSFHTLQIQTLKLAQQCRSGISRKKGNLWQWKQEVIL
jgi:hypothetical protein